MTLQPLGIERRSATPTVTPPPSMRRPIEAMKLIDVSSRIGCKACQVAYSERDDIRDEIGTNHGVYGNPINLTAEGWTVMRFPETKENGRLEWLIRKDGCMHCADPGCLRTCPSPGAITQYQNGIVDFHQENYIDCGYCIAGCPFNIPRLNKEGNRTYEYMLCSDRVTVGQEPACVKICPTGTIQFDSEGDMRAVAQEYVKDLNRRGYKNASLYNPQGIGGTHVMYVLHYADRPSLYHDLPENPNISKTVELREGFLKPLAIFSIAAATLAGYFHYITVDPSHAVEDGGEPEVIDKNSEALPREENA